MSDYKKRQHFRIKYPAEFRPELIINGVRYKIIDVSESGMRYENHQLAMPPTGEEIVATIGFVTGAKVTIKCVIVRTLEQQVMIKFVGSIDKTILKAEADRLIDCFGEIQTDSY